MRYLVTGAAGFVGAHLIGRLTAEGHEIAGVDAVLPPEKLPGAVFHQVSLMDRAAISGLIEGFRPERVVHLASASSVALSWQRPVDCFVNNTNIFLNVIEALRESGLKARVLSVGSSEEYGPVAAADIPLREGRPAYPMNPYAVARVAQEDLSRVFTRGYGMDIVCTRSFNHVGPGQSERFVVSSFVRQVVAIARGTPGKIVCGDLDVVRDFIDVRDVIAAYECILDKGASGEIYNVCSGRGVALREILGLVCRKAGVLPEIVVDPALIRPIDNPVIIGDNAKLRALGFAPAYGLERSLDDMIAWWRQRG